MKYSAIFWDEEDDPQGNVIHVAEHDLTVEDVEEVLAMPESEGYSASTGNPAGWAMCPTGVLSLLFSRKLQVIRLGFIPPMRCPNRSENLKKTKRK